MITFSPNYAPSFFRFFTTLVIIDCIQHIVIIYYRDFTFCCISLQVPSTPFSSRQLNGLNWYFQLSFPCVGRSENLGSILLVLVELLGVCPAYEHFIGQVEIWPEFIYQIWGYHSFGSFFSGTSHFPAAVIALKSVFFIKPVKLQVTISMMIGGICP